MKPLKDLIILDLTSRLPGPLAGMLLANLGAKVIKLEDESFQDPFCQNFLSDTNFQKWYEELNGQKEIQRFSFKKNPKKILQFKAHGAITDLPEKILTSFELEKRSPFALVRLGASSQHKLAMHDLNAFALTGLLELYLHDKKDKVVPPPFLPFGGATFGQKIALDFLATSIKAEKEKTYCESQSFLYDAIKETYSPFWPDQSREKFLHNGAYPCYALYRLKDGKYVAMAAVEEKYWQRFLELFPECSLDLSGRLDPQNFSLVAQVFEVYDSQELAKKIQDQDLCLTLV